METNRRRPALGELRRINVDPDNRATEGGRGERWRIEVVRLGELRSHHEHDIGLLELLEDRRDRRGRAKRQWVGVGHDTLGGNRHRDGCAKLLGNRNHLGLGMGRTATDQDHRAGRGSQCSNSLFKQCRIGRRRGATIGQALIARSRQREDVDRHADVHRARALRIEDLKRLRKCVGQIGWVAHINRERADRLHKGGLVGQIVQRSVPLLGILGGSTRGENQHRQRIVVRRGDRGRSIG